MKTPFAGVICLAQTQACGQSLGSPWPGGQGEVWRGMERPKAALSWSCSLLPSLLGVMGFSTWGSTGQSLRIQLYCCTCLLVARILAPKISPNRNHLEQTPALKPRSPCRVLQLRCGVSCSVGGHPTQLLPLLPALSRAHMLHVQLSSLSILPESH